MKLPLDLHKLIVSYLRLTDVARYSRMSKEIHTLCETHYAKKLAHKRLSYKKKRERKRSIQDNTSYVIMSMCCVS